MSLPPAVTKALCGAASDLSSQEGSQVARSACPTAAAAEAGEALGIPAKTRTRLLIESVTTSFPLPPAPSVRTDCGQTKSAADGVAGTEQSAVPRLNAGVAPLVAGIPV